MRLGGNLFESYNSPDSWVAALKRLNYSAAYCPQIPAGFSIADFAQAARDANILIAEVGVWNNPLSSDPAERAQAILRCEEKLQLAEEIGAACCVNISGSRGAQWDGPHPANLTPETFEMIVATVREIIDAVQPRRTFYTLETMPWMYPNSTESYVQLIRAIDRPAFAVHFDPVNLLNSLDRYYANAALVQEFVSALGAHIKSVHVKDVTLRSRLTLHLDEVRPGLGEFDHRALLKALAPLGADLPLMLEHMSDPSDYAAGAEFLRQAAAAAGVSLL